MLMERAGETLAAAAETIAAGKDLPEKTVSIKDRKLSGIVNKTFYRMFVKAKDFFATDACIGCGTCAEACPTNAIGAVPEEIDPERCIKCMRCEAVCPTGTRKMDEKITAVLRERLSAVCGTRKANELFL
jgi:ferredoxin